MVLKLKASTSRVDRIPSCLFKSCFDSLSPVVLRIINNSLCTGVVPAALKTAAVTPVPKTNNMDFNNLNKFRPISNLPFLGKILEQTVASQLFSHLSSNDLFEPFQSGFRKLHSTETALVKVTNDLLMASDSGRLSILILLDLSAAFDTIDHSILITRLETIFGVSDSALKWFKSYLSDRKQFVAMGDCKSEVGVVHCGVPQGSVLGPLLFSTYIFPFGQLLRTLGLNFHFYADDTQIYIHSKLDVNMPVSLLSQCFTEIKKWMYEIFLCLNSDKTEVMLIGSPHQLRKAESITLSVDGSALQFQTKLKNLGVIFDANLTFDHYVRNTVKASFFHLRNIAKLRPMLTFSVAEKLINTFVFSRIDYCHALLAGVSKATLNKLQLVQNSAARILTRTCAREHITPILEKLHWLPVSFHIDFKILMLTYKALNNLAPQYLCEFLTPYTPTHALRSSEAGLLTVQTTRLKSIP
uniref:Reverse transcriptase domain-containing protein n=1 Tax=Cyprinus carpio TaxID=7962 RepID=A0A8C1UV32_CYPCA